MQHPKVIRLAGLCLLVLPHSLQACATCYGASDSPMAQGMNWGIMTLLVVIGSVLAGVVAFFVHVGRRSSAQGPPPTVESDFHRN